MIPLNLIWPAAYVYEEYNRFLYLVVMTILVEWLVVKWLLKYSYIKSLVIAIIGNLISGFIGTFLMMFGMLVWHFIFDQLLPRATFDPINWGATYVLMCFGSVLLETLSIHKIYKESIRKLFIPLLIGNVITYIVIANSFMTKRANRDRIEYVSYEPLQHVYSLLDSTDLVIHDANAIIFIDKKDSITNKSYPFEIQFTRAPESRFTFNFKEFTNEYTSGMGENTQTIYTPHLTDTIFVLMKQKNPKANIGWKNPIVTDTVKFVKKK